MRKHLQCCLPFWRVISQGYPLAMTDLVMKKLLDVEAERGSWQWFFFLCFCLCGVGCHSHKCTCCDDRDESCGEPQGTGANCIMLWILQNTSGLAHCAITFWFPSPLKARSPHRLSLGLSASDSSHMDVLEGWQTQRGSRRPHQCGRGLPKRIYPWDRLYLISFGQQR